MLLVIFAVVVLLYDCPEPADLSGVDQRDLDEGEGWFEKLKKALKNFDKVMTLVKPEVWERYKQFGFMEEVGCEIYEVREFQIASKAIRVLFNEKPFCFQKKYVNYYMLEKICEDFFKHKKIEVIVCGESSVKEKATLLINRIEELDLRTEFTRFKKSLKEVNNE